MHTAGGSTTEKHNKRFNFSADFLFRATTVMVLKEPCLSMFSLSPVVAR